MDRAQRHHAMVDFQQHQQRLWVVLEEDHEKVEQRAALLEGLLHEMLEAYDDGVGREDEHGNNWEFPLWQKVHAALAGQLPAAEPPFAKRLREAGPQIAAEVDRMMAATPSEDGREVPEVVGYQSTSSGLLYEEPYGLDEPDELMIVAQHSRIVATLEAEIAEWKLRCQYNADTAHDVAVERDELRAALLKVSKDGDKLRADLNAQPARQVGGDEREQFEAWHNREYPVPVGAGPATLHAIERERKLRLQGWQARAALAPAAVVMPKRPGDFYLHEPGYQRGWVAHQIEIARLNRNPIPVELLAQVCAPMNELERGSPTRVGAAIKLRALLAQQQEGGVEQ